MEAPLCYLLELAADPRGVRSCRGRTESLRGRVAGGKVCYSLGRGRGSGRSREEVRSAAGVGAGSIGSP